MLLLISGNLSRHLLARHVQLHVQSDDLLLHESKVSTTVGTIFCLFCNGYNIGF